MQPPLKSGKVLRFGAFEVNASAGEIRKSGMRLRLQGQPFQILLLLLESPGQIVSRELIRERLWATDTFVDFEHSLNTAVKKLRQTLGDDPANPRFIETVPRRGYRLIASVASRSLTEPPPELPQFPSPARAEPGPPARASGRNYVVIFAACILLIAMGSLRFFRPGAAKGHTLRVAQVTTNAAEIPITGSAVSPDGNYLAYSDRSGIYLRKVATGETHRIFLPDGLELRPNSWFVDGTQFVATQFTASAPGVKPSLWVVPLVGSPRKLNEDGLGAAVSPDGSRIAFLRGALEVDRLAGSEIGIVNADGSEFHRVAQADQGEWLGSPTWSPDGRAIAYIRCVCPLSTGEDKISIEVQRLDGVRPIRLLTNSQLGDALLWTADGRIVYSLADSGTWGTAFVMWASSSFTIWAMPVRVDTGEPSGPPQEIARASGAISQLSVAAHTNKLAFVNEVQQMDVYISELEPKAEGARPPWRLTLSDANEVPFTWTPDSRAVVFTSDRNGAVNIFRQPLDGPAAELIVGGRVNSWVPRLSPDGSQLIYYETPSDSRFQTGRSHPDASQTGEASHRARLMKVLLNGGTPQYLVTPSDVGNLGCGTNGVCIFSTKGGPEATLFTLDPATGATLKLLTIRERCCAWSLSPDGSTLAIASSIPDGVIQLVSLPMKTTREIKIRDWPRFASSPRPEQTGMDWAADGKGLFFTADIQPSGRSLLYVNLQGDARILIKRSNIHWAIPSPDGHYLALNTFSTARNVWFVEDF